MTSTAIRTPNGGHKKIVSDGQSPGRGRSRGEISKPSGRGRSPRSACNFCHDKRVKCVMKAGESRCEQCIQRDTNCIFSIKGKTGPKPKSSKPKSDAPRPKGKGPRRSRRSSDSSADTTSSAVSKRGNPTEECDLNVAAAPVPASSVAAGRERVLLNIFVKTIGKLIPLVEEKALTDGLRERQRMPQVMAAAVGGDRVAFAQAQVAGAISLGALISGDIGAGKAYHNSLRYHTGDVVTLTEPMAAAAMVLGAIYWQHLGEDELKAEWVAHARRVLSESKEVSIDLVLCIEHLDYAREAHVRPGIDKLPPNRRALHTISCLLSNMPIIVDPSVGRATAVAFCDDLSVCIRGLETEVSAELSQLLCKSLRALLLVMLGRRDAAVRVLDTIPCLVDAANGGNPCVVRALPLSWDALLIASALSFLMDQDDTYRRLRAAVETAMDVPLAARWTFCLPEPGSDPHTYVTHECQSSSNICTIMCEIASKTIFGRQPFYPDEQSLLRPPTVELSPESQVHQQRHVAPPAFPRGESAYGYGAGGMAVRGQVSSTEWGGRTVGGEPFMGGGVGVGVGGLGSNRDFVEETGVDPVAPGSSLQKRRKVVDANGNTIERNSISPDASGRSASLDLHPAHPIIPEIMPPSSTTPALAGSVACLGNETESPCEKARRERKAMSAENSTGGTDDDEDDGLGLTRGLHNMSLSRLSVPLLPGGGVAPSDLQQDQGLLGRVPSEGIMDLGSTIGSFAMDIGGAGDGGSGVDFQSGDDDSVILGSVVGGMRRSSRRVSSFSTYSASLCRSGSMMMMKRRLSAGTGSIGQCSDIGHDIIVAAEDFMDEDGNADICGNMLSVDAILGDVGSVLHESTRKECGEGLEEQEDGKGSGDGSSVNGARQFGGEVSVGLRGKNRSIARALADIRGENIDVSSRTPFSPGEQSKEVACAQVVLHRCDEAANGVSPRATAGAGAGVTDVQGR